MSDTTSRNRRAHGLPPDGGADDLADYLTETRCQLARVAAGTLSLIDESTPEANAYLRSVRLDILAAAGYLARASRTLGDVVTDA